MSRSLAALIYSRVSHDRVGLGRSVGEQEAECRQVAEQEGWAVTVVLCDNDRSASRYAKKRRPAYEELKRLLATGTVDVVMAWEASRLHRDMADYVRIRDLCAEHGVLWHYSGRTYDMSN